MDDQDSLEVKDENTSHSFAESDDKSQSISTPIKSEDDENSNDNADNSNDKNDSEVERSDNESSADDKESIEEQEVENNGTKEENDNNEIEEDNDNNEMEEDNNNDEIEADNNNDDDGNSNSLNVESKSPKNNDDEDEEEEVEKNTSNNNSNENNDESDNHSVKSSDDDDQELRKANEVDEIFGNSDSEDDDIITTNKKRKIESSSDDNDSDTELPTKNKKTKFDDSDEDDDDQKKEKAKDNDDDDDDDSGEKKTENEILPDISSSSEDELEDDRPNKNRGDFVYDFDIMMAKKKEQNSKNRKRKNTDLINDNDDFICEFLNQMKQAAEDDFELNKDKKAATRKMKLLPQVQLYLRKIDLRESFLDSGVLSVITDWLTPLPDRSLPNLQVRETLLKLLLELNIMDVDRLKSSSVGKAVMYLYKHPKETKENKRKAAQLISNWSRPIFNCETDYQSISKEDREQRDYELSQKAVQNKRSDSSLPNSSTNNNSAQNDNQSTTLKPGDKGWVSRTRARVPAPSTKTYVVRPKSSISDIRTIKIHVQDSKEKFLKKYLRQKKKR